jgi:hypothetical protein
LVGDLTAAGEPAGELNNRFFLWRRASGRDRLTIIVPASASGPLVTGNTGRLALRQFRSRVANHSLA